MATVLRPDHKKYFSTVLLLLFLLFDKAFNISAQTKNLNFTVDFAQFKLNGNLSVIEIYYSLSKQGLTYKKVANGYQAEGIIKIYWMIPIIDLDTLNIQNPDTLQLWLKEHYKITLLDSIFIKDALDSLSLDLADSEITNMSVVKVKQGDFAVVSIFTDLTSKKTKVIAEYLVVRKYPKKNLAISSLQLARAITPPQKEKSEFDKNRVSVIPNATRGYKVGSAGVPYYAEIYNLRVDGSAENSTYRVEFIISDQRGKIFPSFINDSRKKPGRDGVITGAINIQNYLCGFYHFKLKVTDEFTGKSTATENNFYIHN